MSIFTRDCPVCAASHPIHVVRCGCGYCFDPDKIDGITQELEVISQEEQLYRDYLAARAAQADEALQSAKVVAACNPGNTVKSAEALLAEQTAMNARAELDAQDTRAKAVKNRIKVVRSNRRTRKTKARAPASRPAPVSVREALAPTRAAVAAPPTTVAVPAQIATPAIKPIAPTPNGSTTPVKHEAHQAVTRPRPAPVAIQSSAVEPTPAFRSSQTAKARQITTPSAAAKSTLQDCPNCYAKVPVNTKRCRCGYELPSSASQMPALTMSAEDRAAMLTALGLARDTGS